MRKHFYKHTENIEALSFEGPDLCGKRRIEAAWMQFE